MNGRNPRSPFQTRYSFSIILYLGNVHQISSLLEYVINTYPAAYNVKNRRSNNAQFCFHSYLEFVSFSWCQNVSSSPNRIANFWIANVSSNIHYNVRYAGIKKQKTCIHKTPCLLDKKTLYFKIKSLFFNVLIALLVFSKCFNNE